MKLLHTSDWHLGMTFRGGSTYFEDQQFVIDEILKIAVEENIDGMMIAGDVFDRTVTFLVSNNFFKFWGFIPIFSANWALDKFRCFNSSSPWSSKYVCVIRFISLVLIIQIYYLSVIYQIILAKLIQKYCLYNINVLCL